MRLLAGFPQGLCMPGALRALAALRGLGSRWLLASLCVLCALACSEPLVVLGDQEPARYRFEPPELVAELSAPEKTDNPTLTSDLLQIFFTSERDGLFADIYFAERASRQEPFGAVQKIEEVSVTGVETSPAVSADGLSLWFASDRAGGMGDLDIWLSTRATRDAIWSAPVNVAALNSSEKEIPRPLGLRGRVMPMASDRALPDFYEVMFATRADTQDDFGAPAPVLSFPEQSTVDGFLTDDGLALFYVTGPAFGPADMFVAFRRTPSNPFEHHTALDELNTESDERDPWLSPDGTELYFASDRGGEYEIYVARVQR